MINNIENVLVEIKDKCNIVDVVGNYVKLKRSGQNYLGLCPFHLEKTPSFSVNEKKGLFHCFGCGVGGDVVTFIMKYQNIDFLEAIETLASKYGINIESKEGNGQNFKFLYDIHNDFFKLAHENLLSEKGKKAFTYLVNRGINEELIKKYLLGYVSESQDFNNILTKYNTKTIKESGIFFIRNGSYVSRFNGRIIIPIKNSTGKIVAFSGRSINGELPKYINSPETNIFKKREILFNFDLAKKYPDKLLFLTEGYFDVIALEKFGFVPAVCSMGTSLSQDHVKILKKTFTDVLLVFDGDVAGRKAAYRSLSIFLKGDFIPSVIFLSENEDPDSLLHKYGPDLLQKYIDKRKDLLIAVVEREYGGVKNDINKKVKLIERVKGILNDISNPYRKEIYLKELARICEIDEKLFTENVNMKKLRSIINIKPLGIVNYICEKDFLRSLLELPDDTIQTLISDLDEAYFNDIQMKKIFKKIIENLEKGININSLVRDSEIGNIVSSLVMNGNYKQDFYVTAVQNKNKIIYNYLNKERKKLLRSLSEQTDEDKRKILLESLHQLVNEQNALYNHLLEE
jgi:DNA primase